jgi:hypothetical protein
MTAWPEARRGSGLLALVAARAESWLLEPAARRPREADTVRDSRVVVAVVGLGPRCGTTTVARALAIELARRDSASAAFASTAARPATPALATGAARRLARTLPLEAAVATGRLCLLDPDDPGVRELVRARPAPVVLDVEHGRPPQGPAALADHVVLVAAPAVEPALADVVRDCLTPDGITPLVLNRAFEDGSWRGRGGVRVGEARLGARLVLAGRDPTPALARPIAELADLLVREPRA